MMILPSKVALYLLSFQVSPPAVSAVAQCEKVYYAHAYRLAHIQLAEAIHSTFIQTALWIDISFKYSFFPNIYF